MGLKAAPATYNHPEWVIAHRDPLPVRDAQLLYWPPLNLSQRLRAVSGRTGGAAQAYCESEGDDDPDL